ncbi:MAG: hypothetical protein DRP29_08970, partial [Thermodesulfobacteriota bacterium]
RKAGTIGHIGCFSFYPGKNLGSWGEAGACVTNDEELADKMYKIRNHGGIKKYQHEILGGNFRMEEFQGAVLNEKLKYLDEWNKKRKEIAKFYEKYLKNLEIKGFIKLPKRAEYNNTHIYHLYVIEILKKNRDDLFEFFKNEGIEVGIHYPLALHKLKVYNQKDIKFPVAEQKQKLILSLPIGKHLRERDIKIITQKIDFFLNK